MNTTILTIGYICFGSPMSASEMWSTTQTRVNRETPPVMTPRDMPGREMPRDFVPRRWQSTWQTPPTTAERVVFLLRFFFM